MPTETHSDELSASQLAKRTGRSSRAIQRWTKKGCPHERVRGKLRFSWKSVSAWMEQQGLDQVLASEPDQQQQSAVESRKSPRGRGKSGSDAPKRSPLKIDVDTDDVFARMIATTEALLDECLEDRPHEDQPEMEHRRWSQRYNELTSQVRQLQKEQISYNTTRGAWIPRSHAVDLLVEASGVVCAELESLPRDLATSIEQALVDADAIPKKRRDQARRLITAMTRDCVAKTRKRAAKQFRAQEGRLDD